MTDDTSSDKQRFAQDRVVKPFPKVAIGSHFFTLRGNHLPNGYGQRMRISSPAPLERAVDQPIKQFMPPTIAMDKFPSSLATRKICTRHTKSPVGSETFVILRRGEILTYLRYIVYNSVVLLLAFNLKTFILPE